MRTREEGVKKCADIVCACPLIAQTDSPTLEPVWHELRASCQCTYRAYAYMTTHFGDASSDKMDRVCKEYFMKKHGTKQTGKTKVYEDTIQNFGGAKSVIPRRILSVQRGLRWLAAGTSPSAARRMSLEVAPTDAMVPYSDFHLI